MTQENIAKVWEYYNSCKTQYRIWYPQKLIAAIQKNLDGDFSPCEFFNDVESCIHLEVQRYIKYLLQHEEPTHEPIEQSTERQTQVPSENTETSYVTPPSSLHSQSSQQGGALHLQSGTTVISPHSHRKPKRKRIKWDVVVKKQTPDCNHLPTHPHEQPQRTPSIFRTQQYAQAKRHINKKKNHFCDSFLSGYQDSNLGPPAPKAGALTGLRYTPIQTLFAFASAKIETIFLLCKYFFKKSQNFPRSFFIFPF